MRRPSSLDACFDYFLLFHFIVNLRHDPIVCVLVFPVVEHPDVIEHVLPCCVPCEVGPPPDPSVLQQVEKPLCAVSAASTPILGSYDIGDRGLCWKDANTTTQTGAFTPKSKRCFPAQRPLIRHAANVGFEPTLTVFCAAAKVRFRKAGRFGPEITAPKRH